MRKFKYKTSFSSNVVCPTSEEYQLKTARASLQDLREIIPDSVEDEYDLLAIAFNSCVTNLGNSNGDMIDSKTAIAIHQSFIHKPINVEHERTIPIGHIIGASFSEFSAGYKEGNGSSIIEVSKASGRKDPFNLSLSAVLYRLYSSKIVDAIEDSSSPKSENYLSFSASWELAFDEYVLAVGSKRLDECSIISDSSEIAELEKNLLGEGGSGLTPDGKPIFRLIQGDVLPLGIGITENPAADVAGIVSLQEEEEEKDALAGINMDAVMSIVNTEMRCHPELYFQNHNKINVPIEKSSQKEQEVVKANNNHKKPKSKVMEKKIKSTKDITDTLLKAEETQASDIREFIDSEVNKINEEFQQKRDEVQNKLATSETHAQELEAKLEDTSSQLETVKAELDVLLEANKEREIQEAFTARMSHFDSEYDLDQKTRDIVANRIKGLNEDGYLSQKEELEVLLAGFKIINHDDESDDCGCGSCKAAKAKREFDSAVSKANQSTASETDKTENTESDDTVKEAVTNAEQTNSTVANTTTQEESLSDRAAKAFGREAWIVGGKK